jgi:hypothetical protein
MWWDRRTFAHHAEPGQASRTFAEMNALINYLDEGEAMEALPGGVL